MSHGSEHVIYIRSFVCNSVTLLGLRLGKMIAKIGLVQLLRSYDFECVNDAEIEFHNFSITMIPKGGVEIRVVERQLKEDK